MKKLFLQVAIFIMLISGCQTSPNAKDQSITTKLAKPVTSNETKGRVIQIAAEPDSVVFDVARTAIIVVDMENDFCSKGGAMDRSGNNISALMRKTINPIADVLAAARKAGIQIIYLKMAWNQDLSDFGDEGSPNRVRGLHFAPIGDPYKAPDGSVSHILIRDNWGTQVIPELKPRAGDIEIYKSRFSGFYNTNLDSTLKLLNKKYLIVVGSTTSVCVESTVRDAMFRDYSAIVLKDCTTEPNGSDFSRSNHDASLFIIQAEFGWVSTSQEFIQTLGKSNSKDLKLQ